MKSNLGFKKETTWFYRNGIKSYQYIFKSANNGCFWNISFLVCLVYRQRSELACVICANCPKGFTKSIQGEVCQRQLVSPLVS